MCMPCVYVYMMCLYMYAICICVYDVYVYIYAIIIIRVKEVMNLRESRGEKGGLGGTGNS